MLGLVPSIQPTPRATSEQGLTRPPASRWALGTSPRATTGCHTRTCFEHPAMSMRNALLDVIPSPHVAQRNGERVRVRGRNLLRPKPRILSYCAQGGWPAVRAVANAEQIAVAVQVSYGRGRAQREPGSYRRGPRKAARSRIAVLTHGFRDSKKGGVRKEAAGKSATVPTTNARAG